ncbi:hypothetical protein A3742_17665 [Oleiphilus sp. HI0071]|nr:hypothetical protein A3737_02215 [Oleiphilus sp. HI0065]KZY82348.1 hypothetical protein A3742_10050 [Oleiphilus sp. HI0071]KZY90877.1 hypothetical protein A3744_21205 [Oleiphilus sp. HI0073]KZZ11013.1 hypothetical protein A3750_07105 [Oleiphilus sp. HI0079]KZZ54914.1 hypothetical protein A3758_01300 [Oleiphilus sp. HI0118]KZZ78408.1 hypothetical protein A3765_00100 [Oleiphilus sp. HI0130]
MSDRQFESWRAFVEERLGTHFPLDQKSRLQSSLTIRMRELDYSDYDQYLQEVSAPLQGLGEWLVLLDRLVIGETRFYRDSNAMALAFLVMKSRLKRKKDRSLSIWSVGCSSGEETYSLAFLCESLFKEMELEPRYGVTGIDVSWGVLGKGRNGVYEKRRMIGLPKAWSKTYFDQLGEDSFQVKDYVRKHVCFSKQNMRDISQSPLKNQDLIYCQNVLIYFRNELRHKILDELGDRLSLGGVLIIGAGEALNWSHPKLKRVDDKRALAFQRVHD